MINPSTGAELTSVDLAHLRAALELALLGDGTVQPDPLVGAVVVRSGAGEVVGRGHHAANGDLHAEPVALAAAGHLTRGSTLYCNLEPCSYEAPQKRQPPCTSAIIAAGVERVVIGQVDPHPRVRGSGIARLLEAGVRIDLSPDPRPFWQANPVFTTTMTLGRPLLHVLTSPRETYEAVAPWHDRFVPSDVHLDAGPEANSILTYCPDPEDLLLPSGWGVDYLDGQPTDAWYRALEAET